jgi:hypothetical protein
MNLLNRFFKSCVSNTLNFIGDVCRHAKGLAIMGLSALGAIRLIGRYTNPVTALIGGIVGVAVLCS